jgi:hypothetical protein
MQQVATAVSEQSKGNQSFNEDSNFLWAKLLAVKLNRMSLIKAEELKIKIDSLVLETMKDVE